jgi:uncharacterized iron-regulated membrane protein
VLWWPGLRRLALGFKIRAGRTRALLHYDLHKVFGFFSLPVLFLVSASGIFFVFPTIKSAVTGALGANHSAHEAGGYESSNAAMPPVGSYSALAHLAEDAVTPGAVVSWLPGWETARDGVVTVYLTYPGNPDPYAGGILVAIKPATGRVVHTHDSRLANAGEWLETNIFSLHIGTWAGLPGRIAYLILGLSPALLAVTGWLL